MMVCDAPLVTPSGRGSCPAVEPKLIMMIRTGLCILFACAFLCRAASAADSTRHVIVLSLDGFPAYALHEPDLPLPVLRRLMAEGATADPMIPINPTVTWPNHTAIVSGVNAAGHGVIYNGLPVRPGPGQALRIEPWVPKP